jgi:hypothetical protein
MPEAPQGSEWEAARVAVAWREWAADGEALLAQLPALLDDYMTALRSGASSQAASSVLPTLERLITMQSLLTDLRDRMANMQTILLDMQPRIETLEAQHLTRERQVADLQAAERRQARLLEELARERPPHE